MAQVFKRFYMEWLGWITGAVLDASVSYPGIDCRGYTTIWLEFIMDSASAPAGTLFIEWSLDDVVYYSFAFDAGKFSKLDPGTKFVVDEAAGTVTVAALAADSRFTLGIEKPPAYLRFRWVSGAGGIATGASANAFGRMPSAA